MPWWGILRKSSTEHLGILRLESPNIANKKCEYSIKFGPYTKLYFVIGLKASNVDLGHTEFDRAHSHIDRSSGEFVMSCSDEA